MSKGASCISEDECEAEQYSLTSSLLRFGCVAVGGVSEPYEVGRELDSVDQDALVMHETMLSGREPSAGLTDSLSMVLSCCAAAAANLRILAGWVSTTRAGARRS